MIRITQAASRRTIQDLLMERGAKPRLTEHVAALSLRHQQVAEDYLTAIAQVANRQVAVVIYKRNKRHQHAFNVQTSRNKQARLQQMAGLWA